MKFQIKVVYLILILLNSNNCFCQSIKAKQHINYCVVFCDINSNPNQGLSLNDTNSTISIVTKLGINQVDTTLLGFDNYGRINYINSNYEESRISYSARTIKKKSIKYFPTFFDNCSYDSVSYTYFLNSEDLVNKIIIECNGEKKQIDLKHIPISAGRMIEYYIGKNLIQSNLFLYNEVNDYFQWEIITSNNIIFKFKTDKYSVISKFESDIKYRQIVIENITFKDAKLKDVEGEFPDKYSIFDASGNVIGTMNVIRENQRP